MFRFIVALAALLLAGPASAGDRIPVVATFSVIGDILANVGGDRIDIKTIVGAGGDCELYQPTAADVATVASARAIFINDLNEEFEPWLEPLLKQALFKGTKVVVTRNVRTLTAEEEHPVSGRQLPAAIDQHAWLDPRNGVIYVRNIAAALARLDPAGAADYRTHAAAYTEQIQAVDDLARKEMAVVPAGKRRVLASHDSLEYIANAYGITLLVVNGWTNKRRCSSTASPIREPCDLVGVLGPIIFAEPLVVTTGQMEFSERGAIGPQFVGHDQPGCEALLSEQLAHEL